MVARRTSIRTQLFWSVAGIVLLTIVLCAGAVYRLVVIPVEDEFAAHDMRIASMRAADQIRALVRAVENITRNGRAWGSEGLLAIDDPDELTRLMIPVLTHRPEITAVLLAREDGREIFLRRADQGWTTRITDAVRTPGSRLQADSLDRWFRSPTNDHA